MPDTILVTWMWGVSDATWCNSQTCGTIQTFGETCYCMQSDVSMFDWNYSACIAQWYMFMDPPMDEDLKTPAQCRVLTSENKEKVRSVSKYPENNYRPFNPCYCHWDKIELFVDN